MAQIESYPKRVVKGTSILFIGAIAALAVGLLLRAFLARSLSVESYGLFFAVFALFSLLGMLPNLGLNTTIVKHVPEFLAKKRFGMLKSSIALVVVIQASIAGIIGLGLFLFSNQIALAVFGTEAATDIIRVLCFWFFAWVLLFLLRGVFAGFQNMLLHSVLEFLYISIVFSSAVVLVGFLGLGFGSVPLAYLIGSATAAVVAFILLIKKYSWAFKEKILIDKPLFKRLFKFALPVFLSVIAGIAIAYTDTIIITIFRSLEEVGFYQIARPVVQVIWYFPLALSTVLLPMVSEIWAKKEVEYLRIALNRLIKFSFILVIPATLVVLIFPDTIINFLFGSRYLAGAVALQILGLTAILFTLQSVVGSAILGVGKPIVQTKVVLIMMGFNLIGNVLLVPPLGIEGAAIATFFSYAIGVGLTTHFARKLIKFPVPMIPLLKTVTGAVITVAVVFLLKWAVVLPPLIELFVVTAPSLLLYMVWVLATALTEEDLRVLREANIPGAGSLAAIWKRLHK